MRSNSPLHKTEPGAMAYEHSFDARVRLVSKPALAHRNDIHAEREGVIHLLFPDAILVDAPCRCVGSIRYCLRPSKTAWVATSRP